MTMKASDVQAGLRIDRELKAELTAWAKQENRSFNNLVNLILQEYAEKRRESESKPK